MRDYSLIHNLRLSGVSWELIAETLDWFTDNDRKVYAGWCLGKEAQDITNLMLVWDSCLKYISDEDMNGGMDILKYHTKEYIKFPPTPNEFRELCKCGSKRSPWEKSRRSISIANEARASI